MRIACVRLVDFKVGGGRALGLEFTLCLPIAGQTCARLLYCRFRESYMTHLVID